MRRPTAALGSAVFFLLAPGVVVGLIPWWLTEVGSCASLCRTGCPCGCLGYCSRLE